MKSGTRFLCIKKLGIIEASQRARKENLITTLVSLIKIIESTEMNQKRRFLGNKVVLTMH